MTPKIILAAIALFAITLLWTHPSYAFVYDRTGTPLTKADFPTKLTQAFIRSTDPVFSPDDPAAASNFSTKWKNSLKDRNAVQFFRSYPPAYHHDLAAIPINQIPGQEGLCLGDAHPANFGFLHLGQASIFAYNDLDDSGYCPIAYDALRFFTAVRLWFQDDALTQDVLEKYVDTVKDPTRASTLPRSLYPDWERKAAKDLDKYTNQNQFKYEDNGLTFIAASDSQRANILSMAAQDQHFTNYTILDIAARAKEQGGSTGLKRYWLLVKDPADKRSILELKQASQPGVEYGRTLQVLSHDERLPLLKKTFWQDPSGDEYFYVTVNDHDFLVRNRLNMKGLDIEDYQGSDLKKVLLAEASVMAKVHANDWNSVKKSDLRTWLWESSETLAKRWLSVYEKALQNP